jgi:hypothetical protein
LKRSRTAKLSLVAAVTGGKAQKVTADGEAEALWERTGRAGSCGGG